MGIPRSRFVGEGNFTPGLSARAVNAINTAQQTLDGPTIRSAAIYRSPSRTSFLTGARPDTNKVYYIGPYFRNITAWPAGKDAVTLPQKLKMEGWNVTGAGKIFHAGSSSGGPTSSTGGGDMPYSWNSDWQEYPGNTTTGYFWCDQFYSGEAQSPASVGWPGGTGCVQTLECRECLAKNFALGFQPGPHTSSAFPPCDESCFPDGLVADEAVR